MPWISRTFVDAFVAVNVLNIITRSVEHVYQISIVLLYVQGMDTLQTIIGCNEVKFDCKLGLGASRIVSTPSSPEHHSTDNSSV